MNKADTSKKRVLIVTYYWPPSGGAGVQRWLKFSKYLARTNKCFVYTPENPDFALKDESLLKKISPEITVIKRKIFEPYFLYRALLKKKNKAEVNQPSSVGEGGGIIKRMAKWVRGNLFIPDPRKFWIKPATRHLKKIIIENKIDVLITTGPPHSMHLIGLRLKKYFDSKVNWIADFRDPWTKIDFYDKLNVGKRADRRNKKLEREVLLSCDTLVTVSESWGKDFRSMGAENVQVITNGFDPADMSIDEYAPESDKCIITHIGSVNEDRNPSVLWKVVQQIKENDPVSLENFQIKLIGNVHESVKLEIEERGLTEYVFVISQIEHSEAMKKLAQSTVSLLLLNKAKNISGIIPGKLFEYMQTGNPILGIGLTTGDSAGIIKKNNLGEIFGFDEVDGLKTYLEGKIQLCYSGQIKKNDLNNLANYSIPKLTEDLKNLF